MLVTIPLVVVFAVVVIILVWKFGLRAWMAVLALLLGFLLALNATSHEFIMRLFDLFH